MSERLETPWERWARDPRDLQHLEEEQLSRAFVTYFERTVSNDRLIPIDGVLYEIPREAGRGGQKIVVTQRLLDRTYHVVSGDQLVRIHPVELAENARSPRARPGPIDETKAPPEKTAADLGFERDLGPVVDEHGGALPPTNPLDPEEETS